MFLLHILREQIYIFTAVKEWVEGSLGPATTALLLELLEETKHQYHYLQTVCLVSKVGITFIATFVNPQSEPKPSNTYIY